MKCCSRKRKQTRSNDLLVMRRTNRSGEFMQRTFLLDTDSTLKLANHDMCNVHLIQPCYSVVVDSVYRLLYVLQAHTSSNVYHPIRNDQYINVDPNTACYELHLFDWIK
jgi:hypothetical protein